MVKAEEERKKKNKWWWVDRNTITTKSTRSPWLHSTLSDLDEMTKAMLKLIDEDADSFAQRAEMFYKKRPELIAMVEEVYRAHRSLAVQYDQVKQDSGSRLLTKYKSDKLMSSTERSYDSYSETYEPEDSCNSDVDDPEEEVESQLNKGVEVPSDEVIKLKEELEKLKEENKLQEEQLRQKDEEKREAIRQLSFAVDMFKEDNIKLRKMVAFTEITKQQKSPFDEFNKFRKVFLGRLFSVSPKKNSES